MRISPLQKPTILSLCLIEIGNSVSYSIFKFLKVQKPGQNGEIHITDAIRTLIHKNYKFIGHNFSGNYLDCGTMSGYINSSIIISKL